MNARPNAMDAVCRLTICLRDLARRARLLVFLRGLAVVTLTALLLFVGLASWLMSVDPAPGILLFSRSVLIVALAATLILSLWIPLRRWRFAAVVNQLERQWPLLDQRLHTYISLTSRGRDNAFLPLLAEEILALAPEQPVRSFIPRRKLVLFGAASVIPIALSAILLSRPGGRIPYWAQALCGLRQPFTVQLTGHNGVVARGRDFPVIARATGFTPRAAELWVKDASSRRWRTTPMPPDGTGVFRASIGNLSSDVDYFVSVDGVRSPRSRVQTVDVPLVRSVEVSRRDNLSHLTLQTDRPMKDAQLDCSCGKTFALTETVDNRTSLALDAASGGLYHVNVRNRGATVRVSDDFELATFDPWIGKGQKEAVPDPRAPFPDRAPPGYENAVREYYRLINQGKAPLTPPAK